MGKLISSSPLAIAGNSSRADAIWLNSAAGSAALLVSLAGNAVSEEA
jgi:hypothetical protein